MCYGLSHDFAPDSSSIGWKVVVPTPDGTGWTPLYMEGEPLPWMGVLEAVDGHGFHAFATWKEAVELAGFHPYSRVERVRLSHPSGVCGAGWLRMEFAPASPREEAALTEAERYLRLVAEVGEEGEEALGILGIQTKDLTIWGPGYSSHPAAPALRAALADRRIRAAEADKVARCAWDRWKARAQRREAARQRRADRLPGIVQDDAFVPEALE